ncbi:hypothetical protein ACFWPK_05925 [Nocardia sp. NPDC058519]|uniref:hypothetical protein n=1 Tax=Nocardia sp. NPDC058519 TaxID=3346535 RepID=UPI0036626E6A
MNFALDGFGRFVSFSGLPAAGVPAEPGVYVVVRTATTTPVFLSASPAGWFKGKDPTLPLAELQAAWVPGEPVLYIGKAAAGQSRTRGLRKRLDEYRRHGAGHPVGHWGGRMIWQLADSAELLVGWQVVADARAAEKAMIADFVAMYRQRPFSNRTG